MASKGRPKARRVKTAARVAKRTTRKTVRRASRTVTKAKREAAALIRKPPRSLTRRRARKSNSAYRSAVSMLTTLIDAAGRNLSAAQKKILKQARTELKKLTG